MKRRRRRGECRRRLKGCKLHGSNEVGVMHFPVQQHGWVEDGACSSLRLLSQVSSWPLATDSPARGESLTSTEANALQTNNMAIVLPPTGSQGETPARFAPCRGSRT